MKNILKAEFQVSIGSKNFDCHLSMNAFRILGQKFGVKLSEIDKFVNDDPLTAMPALAYCAAVNSAMRKGKKVAMDFDQFAALMLDNDDSIKQVSEALAAAFGTDEEQSGNE